MNPFFTRRFLVLTFSLLAVSGWQAAAQTVEDQIQVARSVIQADRQAVVAEAMQITDAERPAFWPLYHQYRAEMDKVGDGIKALVLEYARYYPDVPDDRARKMLKDLAELEKQQATTRAAYLKKIGKVLPAPKTLRFAQVENRLDLALRLQLAATIPLVPIEGSITGTVGGAASYTDGVAGGVVVQTMEVTATVAAIDSASRRVKLISPDGIKQTVKVGPEVINFDQIRVGDQLKVTATEELVVQMAAPGESTDDSKAALVALAPKGAKPGGVMAETTQITATVASIDRNKRTATLKFDDGTTKTLPVRPDVDLGKRQVGDKVVFRVTEMVAISVEKP